MEHLDIFEKYFHNELDAEERESFEQKMSVDDTFKSEYEEYLEMQSYLGSKTEIQSGLQNIKTARENFIKNESQKTDSKPSNLKIWLLVAAMTVVLLGAIFYFTKSEPTPDVLYASYFDPPQLSITTKGSTEQNRAEEGLKLYREGKYDEAYSLLDTVGLERRDIGTVLLGKGISAIQTNQHSQGRIILENLIQSHPAYGTEANYYLALSFLKENDIERCKSYLEKIPVTSNLHDKVESLLKQLK